MKKEEKYLRSQARNLLVCSYVENLLRNKGKTAKEGPFPLENFTYAYETRVEDRKK
jgi:hypothetical protein